jgi:hypothetical protein
VWKSSPGNDCSITSRFSNYITRLPKSILHASISSIEMRSSL